MDVIRFLAERHTSSIRELEGALIRLIGYASLSNSDITMDLARAAEIMAGALRHHYRGLLLGDKTFGLCGLTQVQPLQDGSALMMTVAYCYTPGGRKISGEGLTPDVEGKKPPKGTKHLTSPAPSPEEDPWVKQAVEVLKSGKPSKLVKKAPAS